jgi:hypothetical protein
MEDDHEQSGRLRRCWTCASFRGVRAFRVRFSVKRRHTSSLQVAGWAGDLDLGPLF